MIALMDDFVIRVESAICESNNQRNQPISY